MNNCFFAASLRMTDLGALLELKLISSTITQYNQHILVQTYDMFLGSEFRIRIDIYRIRIQPLRKPGSTIIKTKKFTFFCCKKTFVKEFEKKFNGYR